MAAHIDKDGGLRPVAPDPYTGSADCHGTCAAWYNIACSNILTALGVSSSWSSANGRLQITPAGDGVLVYQRITNDPGAPKGKDRGLMRWP